MSKNILVEDWAKEFQDFVSSEKMEPPHTVTMNILARVKRDLNPIGWRVFVKLTVIHAVVGFITLLFCPQFGVGLLSGTGLMSIFMRFGNHVCMLACGVVFLGTSALVASLVMRPEEVRIVRKTKLLQFTCLGLLSLAVLTFAGGAVAITLALFWLLGSMLGAIGSLEIGWTLRNVQKT